MVTNLEFHTMPTETLRNPPHSHTVVDQPAAPPEPTPTPTPARPSIVLPPLTGKREDVRRAIVLAAKPSAQADDQERVDQLDRKMKGRLNDALNATFGGRVADELDYILKTAADLREQDRISRLWSDADELRPRL